MLQKVPYKELRLNPMTLFGEEWAALTAGNAERGYNSGRPVEGAAEGVFEPQVCLVFALN